MRNLTTTDLYSEEMALLKSALKTAIVLEKPQHKNDILRQIQTARLAVNVVMMGLHKNYPVYNPMTIANVRDCVAGMSLPELSARLAKAMIGYPQYFSTKKAKQIVENYNEMIFETRLKNPNIKFMSPIT